jgi:hypothetical protein
VDKTGKIEIRVIGAKGNISLTPDSYDIKEIAELLLNVESLLYPTTKKDRPLISYNIEEGSVRHVFKTGLQAIIGFGAVMGQVSATSNIDFLELRSAKALEYIQNLAYQKNYQFEFSTYVNDQSSVLLEVTPKTRFVRTENLWLEAEVYLYGTLTNAGGKGKANIHLDTSEFGSLTVQTDKAYLEGLEENLLYKQFGVRALALQNAETGEIDKTTLKMIELIDYESSFDKDYLDAKISNASKNWLDENTENWLNDLRGDYDA